MGHRPRKEGSTLSAGIRKHAEEDRLRELDERAVRLGSYILEHGATVRSTAQAFGISKSTVHKDVSVRLPMLRSGLYEQVRTVLERNKQERHIRGGLATKRKYEIRRSVRRPQTGQADRQEHGN